ncbi:hypothetical protein ABE41_006350 [Fictibacillus arsenicus]|uniref:Uncharacterized protein n=1 Tax=Fictibacillus arsenicus TaxID=255247 RepID=A0A1B1Z2E4_9BACL|nr:hypothetical protein ABE41_006350 [Fictibacillus arsenicus]
MPAMILVAKMPIRLSEIGPAASSPVTFASTFKLTIPNRMRKMTVKEHFFITFKDLSDNSEKALFLFYLK